MIKYFLCIQEDNSDPLFTRGMIYKGCEYRFAVFSKGRDFLYNKENKLPNTIGVYDNGGDWVDQESFPDDLIGLVELKSSHKLFSILFK